MAAFVMLALALALPLPAQADGIDRLKSDYPGLSAASSAMRRMVKLEAGPGWRVRRSKRAFGTRLTVSRLSSVLRAHHSRFPAATPLAIYDLSKREGGRLEGHHSHRQGRDVDMGLPVGLKSSHWRTKDHAAERSLFLVLALLRTCDVEFILLDQSAQRTLLHHALSRGVTADEAALIFQYPGKGHFGMVRHRANHRRHMHVRFRHDGSAAESARKPLILIDRESKEELCYHPEDMRGPRSLIQRLFNRLYGE